MDPTIDADTICDGLRRAQETGDLTSAEADVARLWVALKDADVESGELKDLIQGGNEPQQCLNILYQNRSRAYVEYALRTSDDDIEGAVLALKKSGYIDRTIAARASFCLCTKLSMDVAKQADASTDLLAAVVTHRIIFSSRDYVLTYVKAAIWPHFRTPNELDRQLIETFNRSDDLDTECDKAARACSIRIFMRESRSTDEVAARAFVDKARGRAAQALANWVQANRSAIYEEEYLRTERMVPTTELESQTQNFMLRYQGTKPPMECGDEPLNNAIQRFQRESLRDEKTQRIVQRRLTFRLEMNDLATEIAEIMGLQGQVGIKEWDSFDEEGNFESLKLVRRLVRESWCRTKSESDGRSYEKPAQWLAYAVVMNGVEEAGVDQWIEEAKRRLTIK